MNLQTKIKLKDYSLRLNHNSSIVIFGSCFSENIGNKLSESKLDVCINPFGILFNPISVCKAIEGCRQNKEYTENELHENNQIHFSYNHHSSFSSLDKNETLQLINNRMEEGSSYLKEAGTLIITLGTAWVYRLKGTNEVVANCYKMPAKYFTKELLSVEEIVLAMNETISKLKEKNPEINIITTISPVRHWKDGVVENQQSKSTLHLALMQINETHINCDYFPSYEIIMDELRDYRFYAKDMLHPSELAIDYIWDKFSSSFFTKETQELNKKIAQIVQGLNHKPFNSNSENHKKFQQNLLNIIIEMEKEYPQLDLSLEKAKILD